MINYVLKNVFHKTYNKKKLAYDEALCFQKKFEEKKKIVLVVL